jgi:hypothetical protein
MATEFTHPLSVSLPTFPKPQQKASPQDIAQEWLSNFSHSLASGDVSQLSTIFHEDSWWRDALTLSWEYHTLHGLSKITSFLQQRLHNLGFGKFELREKGFLTPSQTAVTEGLEWIESIFTFETAVGHGQGVLRLTPDPDGNWKAYTVYTSLQELKGYEWNAGSKRPHGGKNKLEGGIIKGNWFERRQRQREFLDEEPTCLVIGAGMLLTEKQRLLQLT